MMAFAILKEVLGDILNKRFRALWPLCTILSFVPVAHNKDC